MFSLSTISDATLVHPLESVKASGGILIGCGVSVTAAKSHSEPVGSGVSIGVSSTRAASEMSLKSASYTPRSVSILSANLNHILTD
jgi:hypothetical protein